jgi:hypothetical protein
MDSDLISSHKLLVAGQSYEACRDNVLRFFHNTVLVKYDRVRVIADEAVSALQDGFMEKLEDGVEQNRRRVGQLLAELRQEGFSELGAWQNMPQGYPSKTVHEIAHLLDGFFGIDSAFYNLIDDSHWVSAQLRQEMSRNPVRYWLIRADGSSQVAEADRVPFLRRHGRE